MSIDLDDWLWLQTNKEIFNASESVRQHIKLIRQEVEATSHVLAVERATSRQSERKRSDKE